MDIHYRRYLVNEGVIEIRFFQLECLDCGKKVGLNTLFLPKRKRYWIEVDRKITELYLSGASYRRSRVCLDRHVIIGQRKR